MNRIPRLPSLALAVVVTIGLMVTTMAPAQAQPQATVAAQAIDTAMSVSSDQDTRGHAVATRAIKAQPQAAGTSRAGKHVKPVRSRRSTTWATTTAVGGSKVPPGA